MDRKLLGRWGEACAADYLRKHHYTVVAAGYRTRQGEIDLIAEDRHTVAFVEVKLRGAGALDTPAAFVDARKQRRIIAAAKAWLAQEETDKQPRFDVIEVYAPEGMQTAKPSVHHIENAFGEEDD